MNTYEAMFIVKPDLSEEEKKALFAQIAEVVQKNNGKVSSAGVWAEKRLLAYPIKKQKEGIYYLMGFSLPSDAIGQIHYAFKLNEQILRVLITAGK